MKKFFLSLLAIISILPMTAQIEKERVAVFDPSGTAIDEGARIVVREIISSTIVNSGKYNIVERSMLEKVMQEQSFSNSGAVDDTQATEIGKLAGANKVLISVLSKTGNRNMLSVKLIDVKTANIEKQKIKVVPASDLLDIVEPITLELIGIEVTNIPKTPKKEIINTPTETPKAEKTIPQVTTTPSTPSFKDKGYKGFIEVGGAVGASDGDVLGFGGIYTTHGAQVSPYFFIGGGLGLEYSSLAYEESDYGISIPLYVELQFNLRNPSNRKRTPYLGLRTGYMIGSYGVLGNLFIGYSKKITKSTALSLNLGYCVIASDELGNALSLRFGIEF